MPKFRVPPWENAVSTLAMFHKGRYRNLQSLTLAKTWTLLTTSQSSIIWVEIVVASKNDSAKQAKNADSVKKSAMTFCARVIQSQIFPHQLQMKKSATTWPNGFSSLVLPFAVGLAMFWCVDLLIDREVIANELLLRYLTGHPISKITLFMFCVGVAGLLLVANNVFDQFCGCDKIRLSIGGQEEPDSISSTERASSIMAAMDQLRRSLKSQYLWQRLYSAVAFVHRTGSTSGIEDELKYLADLDHDRQNRRYAMIRIVIWATPMLGFLGTVLGISQALGGIQVGADNDFQAMLNSLRGSLFVAFDTTALALTLSMVLMFLMFFVDRFESQLLEVVSRRTNEELLPLYQKNHFVDPQARAVEQIGRSVLASSNQLVRQQTEQWQAAMGAAEDAWKRSVSEASVVVQSSLTAALREVHKEMADAITCGIERADNSMAKRWEQWQVLLSDNARKIGDCQTQVLTQIEMIKELITKLESTSGAQQLLNRNLDALATTSRLHETLRQLSKTLEFATVADSSESRLKRLRIHRPDSNSRTEQGRKAA